MTRDLLTELSPEKEPVEKFLHRKWATIDGKRICPWSLAVRPEVARLLEWEADLQAWHGAPPFDGPTYNWPWLETYLMRFARGLANKIQNRQSEELANK